MKCICPKCEKTFTRDMCLKAGSVSMTEKSDYKIMKITKTKTKWRHINVGDKVLVVSECVDFTFFKEGVEGVVVKKNEESKYLGIKVKLPDGKKFGFNPENLKILYPAFMVTAKDILKDLEKKSEVINDSLWYVNPDDIEKAILKIREETIREVEESNRNYLEQLKPTEKLWNYRDVRYFLKQYDKLKK